MTGPNWRNRTPPDETVRMRTWGRSLIAVVGLALSIAVVASADAADPGVGYVDSSRTRTEWQGGPLPFTTLGTGCEPVIPTCDVFELNIGQLSPRQPDVAIAGRAKMGSDVLALYVYGPDGTQVAKDDALTANPHVDLRSPAPGKYSVRFEAMIGLGNLVEYTASATVTAAGPAPDVEVPCTDELAGLGPPPQAVLQAALDDDGRNVDLDILVLLDGVSEGFARTFFEKVGEPYAALNITVKPVFQAVPAGAITSDVTTEIIDQTRDLLPGRRVPDAFDVVELLTHRDITALGLNAVAGQAKCIGGAAFKEHSFNVSEAQENIDQAGVAFGPVVLIPDYAAKITAHEIGHLYGGQHHFANCAEGIDPAKVVGVDSSPCTLMFNSADFIALKFGTVNGRIVRGYALLYSAAND